MSFKDEAKQPNSSLNYKDINFWRFYQKSERLTVDQFKEIGFELNFDKKKDLLPQMISFDCSDKFCLQVEIVPYIGKAVVDNFMVNLNLINKEIPKSETLGWWDEARWHPFCLRWDELDLLSNHISKVNPQYSYDIVLLLLCRFTGICREEDWEYHGATVRDAYRRLGIEEKELEKLVSNTIYLDDEYQWIFSEDIGWEYAGEYPCYSIRNSAHIGSGCGSFPYKWFNEMITKLGDDQKSSDI